MLPQFQANEEQGTLGDVLREALTGGDFSSFQATVAFVKKSDVRHIENDLQAFLEAGGRAKVVAGVDHYGTSCEGLNRLLSTLGEAGEVWIHHDEDRYVTFHPKLYLFESDTRALLVTGSGNFTEGGLYSNVEAALVQELSADSELLAEVKEKLDEWSNADIDTVRRLDAGFLQELLENDYVRPEAQLRQEPEGEERSPAEAEQTTQRGEALFGRSQRPRPPHRARQTGTASTATSPATSGPSTDSEQISRFAMTVLEGDLPQKGSSYELRVTKGIRNKNAAFWEWPAQFDGPDPQTGQYDREVTIRFRGSDIEGYLKDFPGQKPDGTKASADFRLGSIAPIIQSLTQEGDVVKLTLSERNGVDYDAEVITTSHPGHADEVHEMDEYGPSQSTSTGTVRKYRYY